jgi:hypothetical protein
VERLAVPESTDLLSLYTSSPKRESSFRKKDFGGSGQISAKPEIELKSGALSGSATNRE